MKKKTINIISSFYNENENLKNFVNKFEITRSLLVKDGYQVNLILVNDGSTDNSLITARNISKKKKFVKILNLTKNYGQQIAIFSALKMFNADLYGAIDCDGQQDPKYFLKMIKTLKKNHLDVVQMKKKYGDYEGFFKKIFSKVFYYIFTKLTNIDLQSGSSDFYLFTEKVRNEITSSIVSKFFLRGFIHWTGFPKKYIEYFPSKRLKGVSKYDIYRQLDFALTAIYLYGTKLFVKLFILSSFLILVSIFFIGYVIYNHYFLGSTVPGWATLAIIVTLSGSLNLFFCCLITFFSTKLGNILSIKSDFIVNNK